MHGYYSYNPQEGHGLLHDPIPSIVGPRPIGWISTKNADGQLNLAPYSFFNIFSYTPPIVGFSSVGVKDTLKNVLDTGVFVCNLATKEMVHEVEASSERLPYGIDEFTHVGLDFEICEETGSPRVKNSLVALECRLTQRLDIIGLNEMPTSACMVFGQVVRVHIAESLINNGIINYKSLSQVLRGGNPRTYVETPHSSHFTLAEKA